MQIFPIPRCTGTEMEISGDSQCRGRVPLRIGDRKNRFCSFLYRREAEPKGVRSFCSFGIGWKGSQSYSPLRMKPHLFRRGRGERSQPAESVHSGFCRHNSPWSWSLARGDLVVTFWWLVKIRFTFFFHGKSSYWTNGCAPQDLFLQPSTVAFYRAQRTPGKFYFPTSTKDTYKFL